MTWLLGEVNYYAGHTSAPGVSDDMNKGYVVSDVIIDEANDKIYQCVDNSPGAAVWKQIDEDHTHTHASTTGRTANDHHPQSHTIVSHSDTDAEGSELDTLTDGSDAGGLHIHDGRYYTETEIGSNNGGLGASLMGIEDAMALFAAGDVEAALEEVMDMITIVTTTADSITLVVPSDPDSGDVVSTRTINDANTYDVSEVTGAPGFDIQLIFTGIVSGHEPNLIEGHYSYDGNHTVRIEMWNYTGTPQWDLISNSVITNTGGTLAFFSLEITGTITDYCSGGEAKVRFNHAVSGNINHDFSIDYLAIKDDHGIGSGITDHGAMSGLRDNDHRHYLLRLFTHHTIVSGEDLVINDYEQKIVHHNFTVNGSGTVTINGSGDLVAIGV